MTITPENNTKILLVEDEEIAKMVNTMLLNQLGYVPDIAVNGRQALEMAQKNNYDLVFMDIGLPDINGIEVIIKIRACDKTKSTPIVALTAFADSDLEKKCLAAGADQVLTKPTNTDILQEIIARLITQKKER